MKCGLYIITHKEIKNIYPKDRKIMMVGAVNKKVPKGYYSDFDENKKNISYKNANYCELTGLYYFTQHDNSDILSLEHYRRLFLKTKFYLFRYPFLKEKYIVKVLKKYDVIVPKIHTYNIPLIERYGQGGHYTSDLIEIGNIIKEKLPEYTEAYNSVMQGNKTYFCNMFIGKQEFVKSYAEWLFFILSELETRIDISDRSEYEKRVYGFLAERMLLIYLTKNKTIKVCEKPIQLIEKSAIKTQIEKIKNKVKGVFIKNKGE